MTFMFLGFFYTVVVFWLYVLFSFTALHFGIQSVMLINYEWQIQWKQFGIWHLNTINISNK